MLASCAKDFQRCLAWYSGDSMLLKYLAHFTSKSAIVRGIMISRPRILHKDITKYQGEALFGTFGDSLTGSVVSEKHSLPRFGHPEPTVMLTSVSSRHLAGRI